MVIACIAVRGSIRRSVVGGLRISWRLSDSRGLSLSSSSSPSGFRSQPLAASYSSALARRRFTCSLGPQVGPFILQLTQEFHSRLELVACESN